MPGPRGLGPGCVLKWTTTERGGRVGGGGTLNGWVSSRSPLLRYLAFTV